MDNRIERRHFAIEYDVESDTFLIYTSGEMSTVTLKEEVVRDLVKLHERRDRLQKAFFKQVR